MIKKLALIAFVFFTLVNASQAQSPTESAIYSQLVRPGKASVLALDAVLKNPDFSSAAVLFIASTVAFRQKQVEDAAFLMYLGEIRVQFDHALFPPKENVDADPISTYTALQQQLGSRVNPAIMEEPRLFAKVLAKVKNWSPKIAEGYGPGWEYAKIGNPKEAEAALATAKAEFLKTMGGLCTLLQDRAYFAAFKTVRNFSLKSGKGGPSQQAYESAIQTMKRIERDKGIYGFATHGI